MTNESAILGLLVDLYKQVTALQAEVQRLQQQLEDQTDPT